MSEYTSETVWTAGALTVTVRIAGFPVLEVARHFGSSRARLRRDRGRLYIEDRSGRSSKRVLDHEVSITVRESHPDVSPDMGASDRASPVRKQIPIADFDRWPEVDQLCLSSHIVCTAANDFLLSELL